MLADRVREEQWSHERFAEILLGTVGQRPEDVELQPPSRRRGVDLLEFEREIIRERPRAGLAAARARERLGGRPRRLTPEKVAMARAAIDEGEQS